MRNLIAIAALAASTSTWAMDVNTLWDFNQPALSEQRFRAVLASASGDDELVLQTQIARSWGLRKDFAKARDILRSVEAQVATAGPEVRARYALELGRSYASATHPPETQTPGSRLLARTEFERALAAARAGGLDGLAIDAIHMLAFVDTAPADQLKWGLQALAVSDPYVYEELEILYRARGDDAQASRYAMLHKSAAAASK